jgi:hypothetical protein
MTARTQLMLALAVGALSVGVLFAPSVNAQSMGKDTPGMSKTDTMGKPDAMAKPDAMSTPETGKTDAMGKTAAMADHKKDAKTDAMKK